MNQLTESQIALQALDKDVEILRIGQRNAELEIEKLKLQIELAKIQAPVKTEPLKIQQPVKIETQQPVQLTDIKQRKLDFFNEFVKNHSPDGANIDEYFGMYQRMTDISYQFGWKKFGLAMEMLGYVECESRWRTTEWVAKSWISHHKPDNQLVSAYYNEYCKNRKIALSIEKFNTLLSDYVQTEAPITRRERVWVLPGGTFHVSSLLDGFIRSLGRDFWTMSVTDFQSAFSKLSKYPIELSMKLLGFTQSFDSVNTWKNNLEFTMVMNWISQNPPTSVKQHLEDLRAQKLTIDVFGYIRAMESAGYTINRDNILPEWVNCKPAAEKWILTESPVGQTFADYCLKYALKTSPGPYISREALVILLDRAGYTVPMHSKMQWKQTSNLKPIHITHDSMLLNSNIADIEPEVVTISAADILTEKTIAWIKQNPPTSTVTSYYYEEYCDNRSDTVLRSEFDLLVKNAGFMPQTCWVESKIDLTASQMIAEEKESVEDPTAQTTRWILENPPDAETPANYFKRYCEDYPFGVRDIEAFNKIMKTLSYFEFGCVWAVPGDA